MLDELVALDVVLRAVVGVPVAEVLASPDPVLESPPLLPFLSSSDLPGSAGGVVVAGGGGGLSPAVGVASSALRTTWKL